MRRDEKAYSYGVWCCFFAVHAERMHRSGMRVRDPKTGRNVVVEEMTYEQWERWVKSR